MGRPQSSSAILRPSPTGAAPLDAALKQVKRVDEDKPRSMLTFATEAPSQSFSSSDDDDQDGKRRGSTVKQGRRIEASVTKDTVEAKVGISLKKYGKKTIINAIADDSVFQGTDLKVGLTVRSVNGKSCRGLSLEDVVDLLKESQDISIQMEENNLISATAVKETVDTPVGIGLKVIQGNVFITTIRDDSLFADSELVPGLRVLAVNRAWYNREGIEKEAAAQPFKEASGPITVLAENIGFITSTVVKESVNSKVGVTLMEYGRGVIVNSIEPGSLFDATTINVGNRLVCVNKDMTKGKSTEDVVELFKKAQGKVSVIAEKVMGLVVATGYKETADSKAGIMLQEYKDHVFIRSIDENGIFADTDLKVGLRLVSINRTDVSRMNKYDAAAILKSASGDVTLIADTVGLVFAKAVKKTLGSKVGISLKDFNGDIVISSISDDSIFADSDLNAGQKLLSVNKLDVTGMTMREAIMIFDEAQGIVSVVAERVGLCFAKALKETPESKVGISLKDYNGKVLISDISEDGIFADSSLQPGLSLLCVNDVDVEGMTKHEAVELFKEAERKVCVYAQKVGMRVATATKASPDSPVGVSLTDYKGDVVFRRITDDSIFAGSDLSVGLKLVFFNGRSVAELPKEEAIGLFKRAKSKITVVAENIGLTEATFSKEKPRRLSTRDSTTIIYVRICDMTHEQAIAYFKENVGEVRLEV